MIVLIGLYNVMCIPGKGKRLVSPDENEDGSEQIPVRGDAPGVQKAQDRRGRDGRVPGQQLAAGESSEKGEFNQLIMFRLNFAPLFTEASLRRLLQRPYRGLVT